eukprot:TRINITY_DN62460_c1_g2_i1.p1 TRINITY_DN62460_c1_g2~~TRINITY_DN62460_c1_g2_i1.p1  ORF type:complete len:442 (-),score=268.18 TRINITY_DN62460_c1_g2_i1:369-1694(-)
MLSTMLSRSRNLLRRPIRQGMLASQAKRFLNVHEYQGAELLQEYDIAVAKGSVAYSGSEAATVAKLLPGKDCVVKAQVLAGGRGKGSFTNGFKGGVHVCTSPEEAKMVAENMLGSRLVTKQTGEDGKPCNAVFVTERLFLRRETYFAILMDREAGGPVLVGSSEGGMDIEAVAEKTPELIHKLPVDMEAGPDEEKLLELAGKMGFDTDDTRAQAAKLMRNLYTMFLKTDSTLVEINPLGETHDGRVLCLDTKLNFDDNAEFRQKKIFELRDTSQEDPREVIAEKNGLNYIGLDGDIGCLVNGAGLAMATMDAIKLHGGEPANFLDLGGGATAAQVEEAFKLLNSDPNVKAILVNIFGGIMRCDIIALGLIKAATDVGLKTPVVLRLAGTELDKAVKLIEDSGLRMLTSPDLGDAAEKAVRVVNIQRLAEAGDMKVSFEIPL